MRTERVSNRGNGTHASPGTIEPMRELSPDVTEARLYEKEIGARVRCHLCAYRCIVQPGKKGVCRVRVNQDGKMLTLVYGRTIAENSDPVEKKPLFHVHPGSRSYSMAAPGCNLRCAWCQSWEISQLPRRKQVVAGWPSSPREIVDAARKSGCRSIAYTYTEPTIFFEYAYDTARYAHDAGLANLIVTNGYMTHEMLEAFEPYLDAANVDLKAFRDSTYRTHIRARLQPVLDALRTIKRLGIWLEVTTLIIPGLNDDPSELKDLARFVADELGPETPWHVTRFFPAYEMADLQETPVRTLRRAREIGKAEGLDYVYVGNLPEGGAQDTLCPECGQTLIRRSGFHVFANRIERGACPDCWAPIAGIGMSDNAAKPAPPSLPVA
jgi:pyruvate formate lyase activating enzyme